MHNNDCFEARTMPKRPSIPLARSIGRFVGHIKSAISADVAPERQVLRHQTDEHQRDTPQGPITLRRTTIEEVELPASTTPPRHTPPEQP